MADTTDMLDDEMIDPMPGLCRGFGYPGVVAGIVGLPGVVVEVVRDNWVGLTVRAPAMEGWLF